jgi:hypothetical protein
MLIPHDDLEYLTEPGLGDSTLHLSFGGVSHALTYRPYLFKAGCDCPELTSAYGLLNHKGPQGVNCRFICDAAGIARLFNHYAAEESAVLTDFARKHIENTDRRKLL